MKFSNRLRYFPLVLFCLVILTSCLSLQAVSQTTLLLVRHAEKAAEPANDPALTDFGRKRAILLRDLLSSEDVSAIYSTPFKRTRETVRPLADAQGISIKEYDPRRSAAEFLQEVITENEGGVVVISGHSNTIPMMLNELTNSTTYEQFDEAAYDNLFVVTTSELGEASIVHLTFRPTE